MVKFTDFNSYETENGIELHICKNPKFKTNLLELYIFQPLQDETASLTALLPYVLYRGSERYQTSRDFEIRLDELYGADLGLTVLKRGENQLIRISLEIVNSRFLPEKAPLLEQGLELLAEMALKPLFREDHLTQEKGFLIREINSLVNDKFSYSLERCYQEMCADEPFSIYKLGDTEGAEKIEREGLIDHYRKMLRENYLTLFVVGEVEPDTVYRQADRIFTFEHRKPEFLNQTRVIKGSGEIKETVEKMDLQQGKLVLGFRTGITRSDDLYPALLYYNGILGGFPHSKLFQNVREKASLAYYVYSKIESTKGLLLISAGIDPADYQQAREIILEQVERLSRGEFTPDEFNWTGKGLINQFLSSADNLQGIAGHYLLGLINGKRESLGDMVDRLQDVKREEVIEMAGQIKLDTVYFLDKKVDDNG